MDAWQATRGVADDLGATVAQRALARVTPRADDVIPLVGAQTRARRDPALGALNATLAPKI